MIMISDDDDDDGPEILGEIIGMPRVLRQVAMRIFHDAVARHPAWQEANDVVAIDYTDGPLHVPPGVGYIMMSDGLPLLVNLGDRTRTFILKRHAQRVLANNPHARIANTTETPP